MINFETFNVPRCFPILMVYGIIISEFLIFVLLFLPAYKEKVKMILKFKYGAWVYPLGFEFVFFYILLHVAYFRC